MTQSGLMNGTGGPMFASLADLIQGRGSGVLASAGTAARGEAAQVLMAFPDTADK